MKTIFDWLTMQSFRERTAMYIGVRDMKTLDNWIHGYWTACIDADEYERLRTPGGVPIDLLRDYIAMKESDTSTGDIPFILKEAVKDHDDSRIVDRFFSHTDAFMRLKIRSVQHAKVTPDMKPGFCRAPDNTPVGFRKVSLTEGLCWVIEETPFQEDYWLCMGWAKDEYSFHLYRIGPEADADRILQQTYTSAFLWESTNEPCYPRGVFNV